MPSKRQRRIKKIDNDSILDQIERVIRWGDEFRLAFVKCNHPAQRETLRRSLLDRLHDQRVLEITLEKPIVSLLDEVRPLWNPDQPLVAVCVYGLEYSLREQGQNSPVLGRLNHERDLLRQTIPAALLIWLSDFALDFVARGAPDFWAWRSGVYEFQTDSILWQIESIAAFSDHDAVSLGSLSWEEKQKEIIRLEELLRTSQALPQQDKQMKQTKHRLFYQLGFLYTALGRQDEALDRYQQSLKLANELGDQAGEGKILDNISRVYYVRGNYKTAIEYLEKSLAINRDIGNRAGESTNLDNISTIYHARGDYEAAMEHLEKALAINRDIGNRAGEDANLHNLARIYQARGDYDTALRYLEDAMTIQRAIGDRAAEGATLNNLSLIYQARGDYDTALRYLEDALVIQRTIGDSAEESTTLNNFSLIYQARGDYDTALRYLEESLAIQRAIGKRVGLCAALFNKGRIHLAKNEPQKAHACFLEAYRIAREIGYAEALTHLERLAKQLGGDGLEFWEQMARSTPNT